MSGLFELVLHRIEGSETEIQNWQTIEGNQPLAVTSFGPDKWIERAALGRMMAVDVLAVILFSVRNEFHLEQERRIVEGWAAELRKAASAGEIQPRDPVTLLALDALPDGWDWLVSVEEADSFVAARGMGWKCSECLAHLLEETRHAGERYCDPSTGKVVRHLWLSGYEPAPVVVSPPRALPAANEVRPVEHWKMLVQAEAAAEWMRWRAKSCNPTRASIRPHLLKWCVENNVKTDGGINPSDGYLRTHVLSGKHWTPPTD